MACGKLPMVVNLRYQAIMAPQTRGTKHGQTKPAAVTPPKRNKVDQKPTDTKPGVDNAKSVSQADTTKPARLNRGRLYTVFRLENGKVMEFNNIKHADAYEQDNADIIAETLTFDTNQAYEEFKISATNTSPVARATVKEESLSEHEKSILAKMRQHRIKNAPTKSINISYKTTRFSRACVLFIEVKDQWGKPQWYWKAGDNKPILQAFVANNPTNVSCTETVQIVENLTTLERRNLELNENKPEKRKGYANYKLASKFTIVAPVSVTTMAEEDIFIKNKLQAVGRDLKNIMSSNVYMTALREVVHGYSPLLEKNMWMPEKGVSIQVFIQQCNIVVEPIKAYTDHIVVDRVSIIRNMLSDQDESTPKYIEDEEIDLLDPPTIPDNTDRGGHRGCAPGFNLCESDQIHDATQQQEGEADKEDAPTLNDKLDQSQPSNDESDSCTNPTL
jgi:hypothetical protein